MSAPRVAELAAGSLFSGVGGMDRGIEAAGYRTAFQVEWDPHATAVLERHWPDVPRWSDVRDVNGADLPPVDLLTFGSPCQDLSVAGNRAGLDGERSGLFREAIRIIKEMRDATDNRFPRWALWENVGGALSSARGWDFAAVLDHLADAGALVVEWAVLDARWLGVPQRRRRVFVVACFDPSTARACPDPLLPVAARGARHPGPSGAARPDVAHALTSRAGGGGWPDGGDGRTSHLVTTGTLTERVRQPGADEAAAGQLIPFHLTQDPISGDDQHTPAISAGTATGCATIGVATIGVANTITARDAKGAPTRLDAGEGNLIVHAFSENQRNEVILSDYAHQLATGGGKPGQGYPAVLVDGHGLSVRRLTPLECERLMGWPDDHTRYRADGREQTDAQRYRQCGNGVVAPVAEWLGRQLAAVDGRRQVTQ